MAKRIHFFATKNDLSDLLSAFEARCSVTYLECGLFEVPDRPTFATFESLPDFGVLGSPQRQFLILPNGAVFSVRTVPQQRGGSKYAVDQEINEGTVVLRPGIEFSDSSLIAGEVSTLHNDKDASTLMRGFDREVKRRFKRIKEYWLGPEAMARLEAGARLACTSLKSPREFDLSVL